MKDSKHLLITGIQRSGTTFTANILNNTHQFLYLPEPFNPRYGLIGIDTHFPYVDTLDDEDKYSRILSDLFSYHAYYKNNYARDSLIKKAGKYFLGTRAQIRYRFTRYGVQTKKRFLIKDPDAALSSEYISTKFNCQVLLLVRHPGAVLASYKRLGWEFDFDNFINNQALMRDHLSEYESLFKEKNKPLAMQVGLLWLSIYKILKSYLDHHDDWLLISHEDLCVNPIEVFIKIFNWADVPFTSQVRRDIYNKTNSGNPIIAKKNKLHSFKRNSKELKNWWKETLSPDELGILKDITNPVASVYYGADSWDKSCDNQDCYL